MGATTDFGRDLAGILDIDIMGREVTGRRLLAESLARRITTKRGTCPSDPNWGIDVRDYILLGMNDAQIAIIASDVANEWLRDERVDGVNVTGSFLNGVYSLIGTIADGDGPFDLVLDIDVVAGNIAVLKPS